MVSIEQVNNGNDEAISIGQDELQPILYTILPSQPNIGSIAVVEYGHLDMNEEGMRVPRTGSRKPLKAREAKQHFNRR